MANPMTWAEFKETSPYAEAERLFIMDCDGWYYTEKEVKGKQIVEGWTFNDMCPGELIILIKEI